MLKYVVAAAALIALASRAIAADLGPVYYGPVAPDWSWTGCYAGVNAGGLWGSSDKWIVRTPGGAFEGQSLGNHDLTGRLGGVRAGCDYQTDSGFVVGVQGDYGWADAKGTHASAQETGVFYHSKVDSLASLTGRFGYARDRFLGYVKAGAAWERADYSASTIVVGTAFTASTTRTGWTVGAGGEYAVTTFLSVLVEYGYYDFGTTEIRFAPRIVDLRPAFVDIEENTSVVRVGINLRFGG